MSVGAEFATVAVVHLLAVASPGPDFAMVVRQSLVAGRSAALWTSLGIGAGILVHVAYSLFGLGLIISQSLYLFELVKLAGAAYLCVIGWKSLRAGPQPVDEPARAAAGRAYPIPQALRIGFLTNALNPKATLFFLSLFSVVINAETPQLVQLGYGLYMALATAFWFCGLSLLLSQRQVRQGLARFGHLAERLMGIVLIGLGIRLALAQR